MLNRVLHLVLIALGSLVGLSLCAPVHATTYPTYDLLSHSNTIGSNGDYEVGGTPNTKISSIWISDHDNYKGSADGYVIGTQGRLQAYSHATSPQYTNENNNFTPTDYAESTDRVTITDFGFAPKNATSMTIKMVLSGSYTQAPPGVDGSFAATTFAGFTLTDVSSNQNATTNFSTSPNKYPGLPHTLSATIPVTEFDDIEVEYFLQAFTYINGNIYFLTNGDTTSDALVDLSHTATIYIDTDNGAFIASNGYDYSSPSSPVPIPGTLLLVGPVLVGLAAARRRFNR